MIICIVDTTVLCELLDVPNKAGRHAEAVAEFEAKQRSNEQFLLPLSVVIETGNHIAHAGDGHLRRATAERFVTLVGQAIDGQSPFTATPAPSAANVRAWLECFVDDASAELGIADRSIIALWEEKRIVHRNSRVYVWSYDQHLQGYDGASG